MNERGSCSLGPSEVPVGAFSKNANGRCGYLLGAVLMLVAAVIAARYGVAAERKPLESVSRPLAAAD
jgi:hypothetical protein